MNSSVLLLNFCSSSFYFFFIFSHPPPFTKNFHVSRDYLVIEQKFNLLGIINVFTLTEIDDMFVSFSIFFCSLLGRKKQSMARIHSFWGGSTL